MGGSPRAATIGAVFYALDPYFVRQSVSFIEVPFLVTLLLWTLQQVLAATTPDVAGPTALRGVPRSRHFLVGALLGALVLTRASLAPLVAAAVVLLARRRGWRSALVDSLDSRPRRQPLDRAELSHGRLAPPVTRR